MRKGDALTFWLSAASHLSFNNQIILVLVTRMQPELLFSHLPCDSLSAVFTPLAIIIGRPFHAPPPWTPCLPQHYNYNAIWRAVLQQFATFIAHASLIASAIAALSSCSRRQRLNTQHHSGHAHKKGTGTPTPTHTDALTARPYVNV